MDARFRIAVADRRFRGARILFRKISAKSATERESIFSGEQLEHHQNAIFHSFPPCGADPTRMRQCHRQ
jgi:hypothetical protein